MDTKTKPLHTYTSRAEEFRVQFRDKGVTVQEISFENKSDVMVYWSANIDYKRAKRILRGPSRIPNSHFSHTSGKIVGTDGASNEIYWQGLPNRRMLYVGCKPVAKRVRRRLLALIEKYEKRP
jgi:hypothetical protein